MGKLRIDIKDTIKNKVLTIFEVMKYLLIILVTVFTSYAQESDSISLFNDGIHFVGIDNTNNSYYIKDNVLYKKTKKTLKTYANIHLGKIDRVDITNALKIVVFYKDFNSIILLDNQLNELTNSIDFTTVLNKNISYVGTTINANLWLFSNDDNSLQIWNYKTKKTIIDIPLQSDFKYKIASSNYRNIWLFSSKKGIRYNVYGSFMEQIEIENIKKVIAYKKGIICLTDTNFFYYKEKEFKELIAINKEKEIDVKKVDFYIKKNQIYFFDGKLIHKKNLE